jgi:ABC-2 type transport system permease protein
MNKIFKIALREYIATVKTKAFAIGIFAGPVIIGAILLFTSRGDKIITSTKPTIRIGITDESGRLYGKIAKSVIKHAEDKPDEPMSIQQFSVVGDVNSAYENGKTALRKGSIDVYLIINTDVIEGKAGISRYTYKTDPVKMESLWKINRMVRNAIIDQRCVAMNLDRDEIDKLWNVNFDEIVLGESDTQEKKANKEDFMITMMMPFAMMFLIYIGIISIGQHILSSVIEEKNSRIIEVLLSAVSPFQLMAGKIFGLVGVGLTVVAVWCFLGFSAGGLRGIKIDLSFDFLIIFIIYYILGFMFFSALLAGFGSLCNTIKESQSLMGPVVMVLIIPMLSWYELARNPNGIFARVLSMIPPVSPLVMVLRLAASSDISQIEIIISLTILLLAVIFAFWLAGKVFRTGILMYGKKPKLKEVYRWIRSK